MSTFATPIAEAVHTLQQLRMTDRDWPKDRFVSHRQIEALVAKNSSICPTSRARELSAQLDEPDRADLLRLALRHNNLRTALAAHNEAFVTRRCREEQAHFDAFGPAGLTQRQREAVVTDGDITLVVAGAGTGKTTTIVAKIDYLIRRGLAKPDEILVLAYNKQAQVELKTRIQESDNGHQVRAVTFHAFGYGAVRSAEQSQPEPIQESVPRAFLFREIDNLRRNEPVGTPMRRALESFRADFASQEKLASFVSNMLNFLNRYKTRRSTISLLRQSAKSQRQLDFIQIFERISGRYSEHLRKINGLDFSDMIVRATDLMESGAYRPRYRYILIDEFQDITRARWRMVASLRNANPGSRLFVVGDDWQSIYAFDDADVSIMTALQRNEPGVERVDLDTTFRFPQPLADVSSQFIMRNPGQLTKAITSTNSVQQATPVVVHRYRENDSSRCRESVIRSIVESIAREHPGSTVLVLGRYRKSIPDAWSSLVDIGRISGLTLTYHTSHAAKGLEADEVIVLDVNGGAMGFPCRLADDEFIQLLPTPSETFADAEERRLFYVSLTRSRNQVHLVVDETKPSSFLDDIEGTAPAKKQRSRKSKVPAERLAIPIDPRGRTPHCPSCNKPTFIKRAGANGPFWGCSDFPKCWGRAKKCPSCGELAFVLDAPHGSRYCAECGRSA